LTDRATGTRSEGCLRSERYPIFLSQDPASLRWTAYVGIHDAATEDELMDWLDANVAVEWVRPGIGWASPPAGPPRHDR
jgi:hypothetical protein